QVRDDIDRLVSKQIRVLSAQAEKLRLDLRKRELNGNLDQAFITRYDTQTSILSQQLISMEDELGQLRAQLEQQGLLIQDMKGQQYKIPLSNALDIWYPNQMSLIDKFIHWSQQGWKFLSQDPRESNSEGGVFPAMVGT
ncbi:phosphate ABC transporter permease, partial [Vibrio xuii]